MNEFTARGVVDSSERFEKLAIAYQKLAAFYYMKARRADHVRSVCVYQRAAAQASRHARMFADVE